MRLVKIRSIVSKCQFLSFPLSFKDVFVLAVRSLASVAYRMSKNYPSIHFNYFSIDYKEELSGLYGGVLWQQTGEHPVFFQ